MDAKDVLQRYALGKRDFRGINLSEACFKGADLTDADFSECDLRGTTFARANLTGVRFCGASFGLPVQWSFFLGAIAMGITIGIMLVTGYCVGVLPAIFSPYNPPSPLLWPARGLTIAALYFPLALALALRRRFTTYSLAIIAVTLASAVAATGLILGMIPESEPEIGSVGTALFAVSLAIAVAVALVGAVVDVTLILTVSCVVGTLAAVIGNFAGFYGATYSRASASASFVTIVSIPALILLFGLLLSFYPGSTTTQDRGREPLLRTLTLMFATAIAGTHFTQANLTDANFSSTDLQNVNFKRAILTGTNFCNARKLHRVLCSKTIMSNDRTCE